MAPFPLSLTEATAGPTLQTKPERGRVSERTAVRSKQITAHFGVVNERCIRIIGNSIPAQQHTSYTVRAGDPSKTAHRGAKKGFVIKQLHCDCFCVRPVFALGSMRTHYAVRSREVSCVLEACRMGVPKILHFGIARVHAKAIPKHTTGSFASTTVNREDSYVDENVGNPTECAVSCILQH